jgi:spore coat polysaccharide biosynthesis protein SpsF (cytidylyltransferase family)
VSPGLVPVILQARTGSTRLPRKALAPILGRPLIEHCLRRLLQADVGPVYLATTTRPEDDVLSDLAGAIGVAVVRGPEDDVLQRFVMVADYLDARFLIRATGDNPAVDMEAPRRVIDAILATGADHVVERGLPMGAAVEGVRTAALYQAAAQTTAPYDREHVTPFLYRTPARFAAVAPLAPRALRRPDLRLTVDTPEDLEAVRSILERAGEPGGFEAPLAAIIAAADSLAADREGRR